MRLALPALAIMLGAALAGPAGAANHALLVGVSDYDETIGLSDLRGPANDVRLLRDALSQRGDFDVTVLADGVEGGARPTRAAILGALADLADRAGEGELVYIHLSGHGTRQRDAEGDESDGLDEVFLPADTARAAPGTGTIPNAIRDEELGAAVAAIRAAGADVWFVLDSCHAGSGLRAGGTGIAARFVDPAALGVDLSGTRGAGAAAPALDGPGGADLPGGYIAFYSARSDEVAREVELVPDAASGNGWYGLFTAKLAARLAEGDAITYRQLFQAVMDDMAGADIPGAARLQTPLWEGTMIDATVLGGRKTAGLRQFAVTGSEVSAGRLHGLTENTIVALVADAAAAPDQVLGHAQVEAPDATTAFLAPVAADCTAEADAPCPRLAALPGGAAFARVVARPVDLVVTLSPPTDLATGAPLPPDDPRAGALNRALDAVAESGAARVEIAASGADIPVAAHDGALWFGQAVGIGDSPVGLSWAPGQGDLAPLLVRIWRAEEVARMLESVGADGSALFGSPVEVALSRSETAMTGRPRSVADLRGIVEECRRALASARAEPWPAGDTLKQCDQLAVEARGLVDGPPRDINRIHIDSQFCIETAYQRLDGIARPALVGQPITICADCPNGETGIVQKAGFERLFVVVTEAQDNAEALDLRGLLETCEGGTGATRSAGAAEAAAFLSGIARQGATRGSLGALGLSNIWVEGWHWTVLPRSEAIRRAEGTAGTTEPD